MPARRFLLLSLVALPLLVSSMDAAVLKGTVVDDGSGEPVEYVYVLLLDEDGETQGALYTDKEGVVEFKRVPPGTYTLTLRRIGYEEERGETVQITEGAARSLTIKMDNVPYVVDPIVVTASRSRETFMRSARSTSVVDSTRMEEAVHLAPHEVLRTEPQVDFRRRGLIQATYNLRENANIGNLVLLVMQDYRYTALPALELNFPYLLGTTSGDVERIELARGPSAALYGPDGESGVVHIITRSPLDSPGTSFSLAGGERSVFQGWMRHAGIVNDKLGYKISGEYFRGDDWEWEYPEASQDIRRAVGEARVDWRPDEETTLIFSGGSSYVFELTDQAPSALFHAQDLRYNFVQTRFHRNRWMANVLFNENHTGSTINLLTGLPLVERSRVFADQIQYGNRFQLGSRVLDLTYGLDHRFTDPRTEETLNGRNEENDTITEVGGYVHGKASMSQRLDLLAALRLDYNDRMNDPELSPRFGLVYQPAPDHAARITYERSFASLTSLSLFQDFVTGGKFPFQNVNFSVPKGGLTYRFDCDGPCMRSLYVAGGLDDYGVADATRTWEAMQQQFPELASIAAPTSGEVETDLMRREPGIGFVPVTAADIQTIEQAKRQFGEVVEIGYKGFVSDRLQVGADVWWGRWHNGARPVNASTNVFYNRESLEQYLLDQGMSPAVADSLAGEIAGKRVGTINPEQVGASSATYSVATGVESVSPWTWNGAAVSVDYTLTSEFKLAANYMWKRGEPKNRAAGRIHYDHAGSGVSSYFQVRYRDRDSNDALGVWPLPWQEGSVDAYVIFDFNLRYRPRWAQQLEFSLTANNLFDNKHQQVIGAPEIGRLILTRIRVDL